MLDSFEDRRLTPKQLFFVPEPGVKNAPADPESNNNNKSLY